MVEHMTELDKCYIANKMDFVRKAYPQSKLSIHGSMCVIKCENTGKVLCTPKNTIKKAWGAASEFAQFGG